MSRGSILGTSNEITARHPAAAWVGAVSRDLCGALKYGRRRQARN
jgi:hypothetical protein